MKRLPILAITLLSIAFLTSVSFGQVNETNNSKEKVNSQVSSSDSKSVQVQNNSGSYQKQNKQQNKTRNGNDQKNGTAVRKMDGSGNKEAVRNSSGSGVRKYDGSGNGKGNRKGTGDCDKMEDKNLQNNY